MTSIRVMKKRNRFHHLFSFRSLIITKSHLENLFGRPSIIITQGKKMTKTPSSAIFWDYENIPFRHVDWRKFVEALNHFIKNHDLLVVKCFYRDLIVSDDDKDIFQMIHHLKLKRVMGTEHNAVDKILIQSCKETIRSKPEIRHVIIISGDGDFLPLVKHLHQQQIKVSVICLIAKGNLRLINSVKLFPYEVLVAHPDSWWKHPQKKKTPQKRMKKRKKRVKSSKSDTQELEKDDVDPYGEEEISEQYVYDDGDWQFQKYDYAQPAFDDDEPESDEIVYPAEETYWY